MIIAYYTNILPEPIETTNYISKYQFVETKKGYVNAFTEIRKFGHSRYFIRHTMSNKWTISNQQDLEIFIKNYLRLS